jgi:ribonuclease-3
MAIFSRRKQTPLEKALWVKFKNPSLLEEALTHTSFCHENPGSVSNERLEFLGDAVLDFLSGAWLYGAFPEMDEGQLTRLRSSLVRTEQLAAFAQDLGLGEALRLGRGEETSGGRQRPALLCAVFEALIGAIYLDAGLPETSDNFKSFEIDRMSYQTCTTGEHIRIHT